MPSWLLKVWRVLRPLEKAAEPIVKDAAKAWVVKKFGKKP